VGARIRELRLRSELSQRELGERLDRKQGTISSWESGQREPGLEDLVSLSRVLDVPVGELFAGAVSKGGGGLVLRAQIKELVREELIADVEAFAAAAEVKRSPRPVFEVRASDAVAAAGELLAAAGVSKPPVPLSRLVRGCGVRLLGWEFDPNVSGMLLDLDTGAVIGFNASHTEGRRRFSVAHELGHFVLGHRKTVHVDLAIATSSHGEPPGYDWQDEQGANAFAAELLMPADLVRAAAVERPNRHRLARTFRVSDEAMGFRLVGLGLY
jgi:transcriptional regulator with XRE-family HTH domain